MNSIYLEPWLAELSTDEILARDAVKTWSIDSQIEMVTEELGELIVAIQKWKRRPSDSTVHDIAEEVADVELVLLQLQYIFDEHIERKYSTYLIEERQRKRERLRSRINNATVR